MDSFIAGFMLFVVNLGFMGVAALNYLSKGIAGNRGTRALAGFLLVGSIFLGVGLSSLMFGMTGALLSLAAVACIGFWLGPVLFK